MKGVQTTMMTASLYNRVDMTHHIRAVPGETAMGPDDSAYRDLAQAVILRAVSDFRQAYQALRRHPGSAAAQHTIRETVSFFSGRHFAALSDLDGRELVKSLTRDMNERLARQAKRGG